MTSYEELDDLPSLVNSLRAIAKDWSAHPDHAPICVVFENAATAIGGLMGEVAEYKANMRALASALEDVNEECRALRMQIKAANDPEAA